MQILRLFILSCSHIALSLRQVKSTNRPRPAGFSQKFSARFRKGHPLPCKLARGVRQAFGGSQNLPRGVRHVFGGSQNLPRGVRHVFGGSQKLPRGVRHVFGGSQKLPRGMRHVFGGPGNQRGVCGTFSGGHKTSAECAAHFRGSRKTGRNFTSQLSPSKNCSGKPVFRILRCSITMVRVRLKLLFLHKLKVTVEQAMSGHK